MPLQFCFRRRGKGVLTESDLAGTRDALENVKEQIIVLDYLGCATIWTPGSTRWRNVSTDLKIRSTKGSVFCCQKDNDPQKLDH